MKTALAFILLLAVLGIWTAAILAANADLRRQQVSDDDDPISFDAGLPEDD